jgi:ATP-dependent Clp protease protease subunit
MPKTIEAIAKTADIGELHMYGVVDNYKWYDSDVTPPEVAAELKKLKGSKEIHVYMNSPGGNVSAGMAIYNDLKNHPARIIAHVTGIAGSMMSVILQSADERHVAKSAMVMVHKVIAGAVGYATELRKVADLVDKLTGQIVDIYADRAGTSKDEISSLMDAETYMTGEEAVAFGFADVVEENKTVEMKMQGNLLFVNGVELDTSNYKNFPKERFEQKNKAGKGGPSTPIETPAPAAKEPENIDYSEYESRVYANVARPNKYLP